MVLIKLKENEKIYIIGRKWVEGRTIQTGRQAIFVVKGENGWREIEITKKRNR